MEPRQSLPSRSAQGVAQGNTPARSTGKIFISYRRKDTQTTAIHIYDRLEEHFGREAVFFDVDTLAGGSKFAVAIDDWIAQSAVQLVVIGPRWLSGSSRLVGRGLFRRRDFVRLEIEAALRRGVHIIPVLVDGAQLPPPGRCPNTCVQSCGSMR